MRFVCRSCRHEVGENAATCGGCDAVLDSRSRIALAEIGLEAPTVPPSEKEAASPSIERSPEPQAADGPHSGGIISGSDKSAAKKSKDGSQALNADPTPDGPPSSQQATQQPSQRSPQRGAGLQAKKRRKPARKQRRPGRPYGGVRPDAKPKVAAPPEPVPAPNSTPTTRGSAAGPPPLASGPGLLASPGVAQPGGPAGVSSATSAVPQVSCPSCRADNDPGKNFCSSCRQPLQVPKAATQAVQRLGRDPWYRRLLGTTRFRGADNRLWGQRLRDRNLGSSLRHRSGMAAGTRLRLGAAVLALVALVVLLLGPLRRPIADVFSPPSDPVPFKVTLGGEAPDMNEAQKARLSDGSTQVALEIPWQEVQPPHRCPELTAYVIRLDFANEQAADQGVPRELQLYVSKDPVDEGESAELWPGPSLISIRGDADCGGPYQIDKDSGWLTFDVESLVGNDTWIELYIHKRREDPAVTTNPVVVIAEIGLVR